MKRVDGYKVEEGGRKCGRKGEGEKGRTVDDDKTLKDKSKRAEEEEKRRRRKGKNRPVGRVSTIRAKGTGVTDFGKESCNG